MNQLQVFEFETKPLRTNLDDNGNLWWVAKDVCDLMGISKNRDAVSRLRGSVTRPVKVDGQWVTCVSEPGLYQLILKSKKEEALRFQDWITNEVLPSIRKTGSFSSKSKDPEYTNAQEVFKSLASVAQTFGLEGNQALLAANKATKNITGIDFQSILQIELKNPIQERPFTPTELGKRIGLTAQQLNKKLSSAGLQVKKNDVWCATEKGKSYSVLMDTGKKHSNGTPVNQLKWIETVLGII